MAIYLMYWAVGAYFFYVILYHIIKKAVKNGMKEALYELERETH